jgi:hypothetical protein
MSGPKVVRIVTREEILATCQSQLARLDAAMASWERRCRKADCLDEHAVTVSRSRRDAIAALLQNDEFLALQKQVAQEIAFLESDMDRRLAAAAEAKAAVATRARRQSEAAGALIKALEQSGAEIDATLLSRLQRAARGKADPEAVTQAFALLGAASAADAGSGRRQELAAQYRTETGGPSFESWLASQPASSAERRIAAVEKRLAELAVMGEPSATELQARAVAVMAEADPRRSLLLDSLELDLAKVLAATKLRNRLAHEIDLALAELRSVSSKAAQRFQESNHQQSADLEIQLQQIRAATADARDRSATECRRAALLQGLASLGYEASEGMQTAWATDGRVVLRNASRPDYGVEVAGSVTDGRVQMRPVAFAAETAPQNKQRDTDAESIWCTEVGELTALLKQSDVDLKIERAAPVGAVPVKRVAPPGGADRTKAHEGTTLKTRTLS